MSPISINRRGLLGGMAGAAVHLSGWLLIFKGNIRSGAAAVVLGVCVALWRGFSLSYDWWPLGGLWRGLR